MRKHLFKYAALTAALFLAWNCSDDDTKNPGSSQSTVAVYGNAWVLNAGKTYVIYPDRTVTDENGVTVGSFPYVDGEMVANIVGENGEILVENVDLTTLPFYEEANSTIYKIKDEAWHLNDATGDYLIYKDGTVYDAENNLVALTDMSTAPVVTLFSVETQTAVTTADLSTLRKFQLGDKGTEAIVDNNPQQGTTPSQGGTTPDTGDNGNQDVTTPTSSNASQGGTTIKSSASTAKSSTSTAKSSASTAKSSDSQGGTSSNYTIKYVSGGKSGSGYATRYWDCCKPHCAWPEHGGTASTCDASGNKIGDKSAASMCDGGNAGICRGQFPIIVNDTLAFAFAATPGGENNCGKCFDLAFTGKGKYATDNHKLLKGKHLIVMSNNVGYDVAGGQFDVMIPGGGFGIFNGCGAKMGWGSQGTQYGGLLDECEKETNYTASKYKSCLTEKCNKSFSSDAKAKEGCLFLATWMNASGNPLLEYKEVECPQQLKNVY